MEHRPSSDLARASATPDPEQEGARARRDLDALFHIVTHDLRAPLRAIEAFTRMALERCQDSLDAEASEYFGRADNSVKRLGRLIDDVERYAACWRMEPPSERVSGTELVRQAIEQLGPRLAQTGATIEVLEPLPVLKVNRVFAVRALVELLSNAVKFTRENQPALVEVGAWESDSEAGFAVRDRGPGVEPRYAERAFQLFHRLVGSAVEGTGTGLALVRQVAESHAGRAWVQSREGGGAEFVVTFAQTPEDRGVK
jgi:two-component system sensor kinase